MVSIVGTIIVAFLSSSSAIIAVFITNRATERRLEIQIRLEKEREIHRTKLLKAEEVYSSLVDFKSMIFSVHLDWVALAKNEISITELNKRALERTKIDVNMLQAKLGIYFPELHSRFEENRELLKPANDCFFEMTHGNDVEISIKRGFVNKILDANKNFDDEMDRLLHDLSRSVNEL